MKIKAIQAPPPPFPPFLVGTKVMAQNVKTHILQKSDFEQTSKKKTEMEIFAFCVLIFEPIRI